MEENWDVVIVGGGAAGLSAAVTLGRALRRVVIVDAGQPRNRFTNHMHTVLGHDGLDPAELIRLGRAEAAAFGVTFIEGEVSTVKADERTVGVTVGARELTARALVVATGLTDELPDLPGLAQRWGRSVLHCPYCHGWEVRGTRIGVLGTSSLSVHQAELLRQWTDRLTFFTADAGDLEPETVTRLRARGIELVDTPVAEVLGEDDQVSGVRLADGTEVELDAIFLAAQPRPHDAFLVDLGLDRNHTPLGSFLAVDRTGLTSHPRIWAVGNVADPGANVAVSTGAGALAGAVVNMALVNEDFDDAVATAGDTEEYWETRYASTDRHWSGKVNASMAAVVGDLPPGDVLELGAGEGGDAVWLAEQGWQVTAVDVSATALGRGAKAAAARGVGDRVTWIAHDLETWRTDAVFDLVTASFLHSDLPFDRLGVLRRAASRLRPGGRLLIVSHVFETTEDIPPWARKENPATGEPFHPHLPMPAQEVTDLGLDDWQVEIAEPRRREATGPDGKQKAMMKDGVILLRRPA